MQLPAEILQYGADTVSHTGQCSALCYILYSFRYLKVSCQTVVGTWECQYITKKTQCHCFEDFTAPAVHWNAMQCNTMFSI